MVVQDCRPLTLQRDTTKPGYPVWFAVALQHDRQTVAGTSVWTDDGRLIFRRHCPGTRPVFGGERFE